MIALDQPDQPYASIEEAPIWPNMPLIQDAYQAKTLALMINITSIIFLIEFVLKVISLGFIVGEKAYLQDRFNILDFSIVIFTILTWIFEATLGT